MLWVSDSFLMLAALSRTDGSIDGDIGVLPCDDDDVVDALLRTGGWGGVTCDVTDDGVTTDGGGLRRGEGGSGVGLLLFIDFALTRRHTGDDCGDLLGLSPRSPTDLRGGGGGDGDFFLCGVTLLFTTLVFVLAVIARRVCGDDPRFDCVDCGALVDVRTDTRLVAACWSVTASGFVTRVFIRSSSLRRNAFTACTIS